MPVFEYEAADRSGALSRGRAEAEDQGVLIVRLREQGRTVLSLRPAGKSVFTEGVGFRAIGEGFQRALRRMFRGVSLTALLLFTGQLSAMLAGGLHLARILSSLGAETANKHFQKALNQVRDAITAGSTFARTAAGTRSSRTSRCRSCMRSCSPATASPGSKTRSSSARCSA